MITDFYTEYLVAKIPTGGDKAKQILFLVGLTLICGFLFWFFGPILGLMVTLAVMYGAYHLFTGFSKEYEYIITNGQLDIDRISGQRDRKRLVTVDLETCTAFGKLSDAPEEPDGTTIVLASANNGETDYYCDAKHKSAGNVRIIFTPNDKIIDGIGMFLPNTMKVEFKKWRTADLLMKKRSGGDDEEEE
ncbi:MAG: hypothetical protein II782_02590 [Oscillospiraceae bacterium]|nr:hypothetical protein [Oscillospiraceae bacterium]